MNVLTSVLRIVITTLALTDAAAMQATPSMQMVAIVMVMITLIYVKGQSIFNSIL